MTTLVILTVLWIVVIVFLVMAIGFVSDCDEDDGWNTK